jgi:hypothetical protein
MSGQRHERSGQATVRFFFALEFNGFSQPETSVRDKSCRAFNNNPSLTQRVGIRSTPREVPGLRTRLLNQIEQGVMALRTDPKSHCLQPADRTGDSLRQTPAGQ